MKRRLLSLVVVLLLAGAGYYVYSRPPGPLVLTGIVTTDTVAVSSQITGRIGQLLVREGDVVTQGQRIAVIRPDELQAERAFATESAEAVGSQVRESEAALRFQQTQTTEQIRQAESTLASTESQVTAAAADRENARSIFARMKMLFDQTVASPQELDQAKTAFDTAQARLESLRRQVEAQRATVALARSNGEQTAMRRNQVAASQRQRAAADAQRTKADVRLAYTDITAPLGGVVDTRVARVGEVVNPGQPIVTLLDPDDLWVRADVEETYIARVRIGDRLTVRLPWDETREGTVFFRGVDASFATQRDVSRTKRDIKTFEVRLRVDNRDRRLAAGMTAYVMLPAH